MNRHKILAYWLFAVCIGTFFMVLGGSTPIPMFPWGFAISTIASVTCLLLLRPYQTPFVKEFLLLTLGAILVPVAMFQTILITRTLLFLWFAALLPLTVFCGEISNHYRPRPFTRILFYVALPVTGLIALALFNVSYRELEEPPIDLTADSLADKNPTFVDLPDFWKAIPYSPTSGSETPEGSPSLEINKSAAVIALDMAAFEEDEKEVAEQHFTTYSQAIAYLEAQGLPWVPSVQMVDQKVKAFSDAAYAAIDQYTQRKAERLGGGRQVFLEGLLDALLANNANEAAAFVAATVTLSGKDPALPPDVAAMASKMEERFLADQFASKPIGYYTDNEELRRVFQQNRFCQQDLWSVTSEETAERIALDIAHVLEENSALSVAYEAILALQARTTNPPGEGFAGLKGYTPKMHHDHFHVALFPPSGSVENALYIELYQNKQNLPNENIMNRLITAIRDGEVDLAPDENSGWYDYQVHALETLLVPERGPEGEKLLLSKAYKERLVEAFRTILTKQRELHAGHLYRVDQKTAMSEFPDLEIAPAITIEPTATCYLRSARALRFLETAVTAILGEAGYGAITLKNGEQLADALPPVSQILYGLYFQVCDDIGMKPELLTEELTPKQSAEAHRLAQTWLKTCGEDAIFSDDVRYIVPVMIDAAHTNVRYWMSTGIRLLKVKAKYAREPQLRVNSEVLGDEYYPGYHGINFVPNEFYIPVEEFAEATGPNAPYTHEEFRKLCDAAGSREAIIRAVERGLLRPVFSISNLVLVGIVLIAGLALITIRRRSQKRCGSSIDDPHRIA